MIEQYALEAGSLTSTDGSTWQYRQGVGSREGPFTISRRDRRHSDAGVRLHDIWRVIALLTVIGVLAIVVSLWKGDPEEGGWADDVWLATAEAGIQILTVGVIGGALAAAWQAIAQRREAAAAAEDKREAVRNERRDRIRAELAQLVGLYNDVKDVRRTLRSLGLDLNLHLPDGDLRNKQQEKRQALLEARESVSRRRQEEQMLEQRQERELALARGRAGRLARAAQTVTGTRKRHRAEEARERREESERQGLEEAERRRWAAQERQKRKAQRRRRDERKRSRAAEAERTRARQASEPAEQLTERQADGFQRQMRRLNRLQLDYEAKVREYKQAELLGKDTIKVVDELELVESYLNALVDVWEERSWMIREGTPLREVSDLLQELYRRDDFRAGFSRPMKEITRIMNRHLFDLPRSG